MRKSRDRRSAGPVLDQAYRAQLQSRGRKVFGRAMRGFRQQLGSNQEDLGDALNMDQSAMSKVERDKMKPDERLLLGLLAQFHDTGVLADAAEAYCFARHLRYEDWYSDRVVRAKIQATFRELPPTWNQIQLLYTQVPPLPAAHYVPRTAFVERLLARVKQSASPGVTGLWGLPGAGKTTILQALGHEPEIWEAFDLVLWSEIGPTAGEEQIRCQLVDWAALLALPIALSAPLQTLAMAVRDSLSTRRVLLLVDDAWNSLPLSLLLQAIPFGHVVVAARVKSVIDSLDMGADIWEVPAMSLDEARTLLGNVTGKAIAAGAEAETALTEIYDLVEGLPLALNLAAPCIRDQGWARTLVQLRERQTRLALLERDQVLTRHDGVRIAFMLSYDRLGAGDQRQRQAHFRALGVLAYAPFSAAAAGAVWRQANATAAEQELLRLCNVSLVQCREGIDGRLSFRLHTLLHDLARELLEERDNEMSEATDRYIQHQDEVAEALRRRLGTQDEPLAQVVSDFAAELPHIDHVLRAMLRRGSRRLLRQDAARLTSILRYSRHLLLYSGRMPLWQEWLDELEPRVANSYSKRLQDQALSAEWHFQMGASLLVRHEFDTSRSFLQRALDLGLSDYAEEVDCRLYLAEASIGLGDVAAALAIVEHLTRQVGKLREPDLALHITRSVQSLLAQMAHAQGASSELIVGYHRRAVAASQSAGDRLNEMWERLRLAGSYLELGKGRQAAEEAEQVLAEARLQAWLPLHYDSLDLLLEQSFQAGDTTRIEALLPEFDEVAGRDGRPEALGQAQWYRGMLAFILGDYEQALLCLEEASRAWAGSGSTEQLDATQDMIAKVREHLDDTNPPQG